MSEGKYIEHSGKRSAGGWDSDELIDVIRNAISDLECNTLIDADKIEVHADLTWMWAGGDGMGGPLPEDPTTICVSMALDGGTADEWPAWNFTLHDMITEVIENQELGEGGPIDPEVHEHLRAIAASLREQADRLDVALERKQP